VLEQIEMKPPALSDIFSLGVARVGALTLQRVGSTTVGRAKSASSAPVSDFNPAIREAITCALSRGTLFASARVCRDLVEVRNETLAILDRFRPRVERDRSAFEQNDCQFVSDILHELEGEEHMFLLRKNQVGLSHFTFKLI